MIRLRPLVIAALPFLIPGHAHARMVDRPVS